MRLLRIGPRGQERPAVLVDGAVRDASAHARDYDPAFFADGGLQRLREAVDADPEGLPLIDADGLRTGSPITRPEKILGIGLNYEDHARETGMPVPDEPIVFMKAPGSLSGPEDPVQLPPGAEKVDWEVELGVVIGSRCRYLPDTTAATQAVAGYCVANDISERAYQLERGGQWVKGKSSETFNPVGPHLVTPDEAGDVSDLEMGLEVNGERMQAGSTKTMIFGVAHLIWYLSHFMVLEPGDLINTGTPPGVGAGQDPPRFLRPGDRMELWIEGLGRQRLVCEAAQV